MKSGKETKTGRRSKNIIGECHTDNKGLFWLSSMLVIPGRSASGVDGARACAQQRRLRFTQRGSTLSARGPSGGQKPVQWVLPTPTAKQQAAGQVTTWTHGGVSHMTETASIEELHYCTSYLITSTTQVREPITKSLVKLKYNCGLNHTSHKDKSQKTDSMMKNCLSAWSWKVTEWSSQV